MIVVFCGLPAVGKSYLADELSKRYSYRVINRDILRNRMFENGELDYSDEQNQFASSVANELLTYLAKKDPTRVFIMDGRPFSKRVQREVMKGLAETLSQKIIFVLCYADDQIVKLRLDGEGIINRKDRRTFQRYKSLKEEFEPLSGDYLAVDTGQPVEKSLSIINNHIKERK